MTDYRNSKLIERYEDVVFEPETALKTDLGNNDHQKKMFIVLLLTIVENQPLLIGITPDSMLLLF